MFNFATIPNVPEATLREMAFMFAFGNTFETIGKHFNLDPNLCRMIAVDNWDKWQHYFNHAHELYRTEQAFLLIVQAITMMNQTTEPKGFVALLRVVLNFFRIPFNRPKKAAPPRPTTPAPQPPAPPIDEDEYDDDYEDDDDWDIPEEIVIATRELTARMEAARTETTPTIPTTPPTMERPAEVARPEPKLAAKPATPTIPPRRTWRQRLLHWLRRFGATTKPPDQ